MLELDLPVPSQALVFHEEASACGAVLKVVDPLGHKAWLEEDTRTEPLRVLTTADSNLPLQVPICLV